MTLTQALPAMQILVADDNDANCLIARTILERAGHSVVTAEHGLHALNMASANKFDPIILDILMPVMDGLSALENIRQKAIQNQETPIFALTAYCDIEDWKRVHRTSKGDRYLQGSPECPTGKNSAINDRFHSSPQR